MQKRFLSLSIFFFVFTYFFMASSSLSADRPALKDSHPSFERTHPVKIRLLPMTKAQLDAEDFVVSTSSPLDPSKQKYMDEYGYGQFFLYEDQGMPASAGSASASPATAAAMSHTTPTTSATPATPAAPVALSLDHRLLLDLGRYRTEYLDNANPMIVRFRLTTPQGELNLHVGLFVSAAEGDYVLRKTTKDVTEVVDADSLFCSKFFKLKAYDYSLPGLAARNAVYSTNTSKELRGILQPESRDRLTQETDKLIKSIIDSDRHRQELEEHIRKAIQQKEANLAAKLEQYQSKYGLSSVPSFIQIEPSRTVEGVFPITLATLTDPSKHFSDVIERIFDMNLRNQGQRKPMSTEFQRFCSRLATDHNVSRFCFRLFGRNPLDGDHKDGCFDAAFDYYFSDSEQAFLEWLEAVKTRIDFETGSIDEFPYSVFELPGYPGARFSELPDGAHETQVSRIQMEFLSYFDMCPACRGTFSYLMTKKDKDNDLKTWVQERVEKFIKAWFIKNNKSVNILGTAFVEASCLSIAKCNKGAST